MTLREIVKDFQKFHNETMDKLDSYYSITDNEVEEYLELHKKIEISQWKMKLTKRIINKLRRKPLLDKPAVMPSLPYDVVIIDHGNGKWYHGFKDPLQHRWYINGNRATCLVCGQIIEKQFRNKV